MDNLEPITRNEMFLNGDDLEPITREEMILAGADLEPLTRHEWFLKKYRGGGDVTIKRLAVTENGTYSESGKAYSPVVVNVPIPPIPENAYLLNNLSGLPADIASFNDGTDLPMASLKVAVTPYQDLSHGDPSPSNICPISGWDEAVVTVADDAESPTTSHEYTIDLNGTRYGGTLDVVSGVLTVDRAYVDLGTLDYSVSSIPSLFYSLVPNMKSPTTLIERKAGIISSMYPVSNSLSISASMDDKSMLRDEGRIYIRNTDYTSVSDFKTAMNGVQLVYELATPITVQLAPTPVKSLEGENNISADCGQITEVKYFKKA